MEENKNDLSLEEHFNEIELLLADMERDDISLEKSFELYEKGMKLLKSCNEKIDKVEKKVQILDKEGQLNEF